MGTLDVFVYSLQGGYTQAYGCCFVQTRFCSSKVSQGQIIDESCVNLLVLYRVEECMKAKQDHFTEVENLKSTGDYHFCHRSCSRAFLRLEANQHLPNLTEAMKRTAG